MTKNIYVLDTSVIATDPQCLSSFINSEIVIPINVLSELDRLKTRPGEPGRNARIFTRKLEDISKKGDIHKGIFLPKIESTVRVDTIATLPSSYGDPTYVDNQIIDCAQRINKPCQPSETWVISKDLNLRIRARAYGLKAKDHNEKKTLTEEFFSGFRTISSKSLGDRLAANKHLDCATHKELHSLAPHECILFKSEDGGGLALGRRVNGHVQLIPDNKPWNLRTRNIEQAFAADLLLDTNVPLVSLAGISGTGKTLLTVACGLESVIGRRQYSKMVIYRPISPMGTDIGYLPGDMNDKLDPWMAAIKDSLEFLTSKSRKRKSGNDIDAWKDSLGQFGDAIYMDALTYIRGRSINNAFIIIDEAQNISKEEIKTILTRAGEDSKIVLTGDIEQIDNTKLDAENNGLSYIIEKFKDSDLAGHITFSKGERSPLATLAAEIL